MDDGAGAAEIELQANLATNGPAAHADVGTRLDQDVLRRIEGGPCDDRRASELEAGVWYVRRGIIYIVAVSKYNINNK